jgi:hypothetical protein
MFRLGLQIVANKILDLSEASTRIQIALTLKRAEPSPPPDLYFQAKMQLRRPLNPTRPTDSLKTVYINPKG